VCGSRGAGESTEATIKLDPSVGTFEAAGIEARLPASAESMVLRMDRRARTSSTIVAALGVKPWLGVYSA
jgi:hypothetical protein